MALSPNYGWAEPDNSSLVKNGAQDIRALGDAIDTSLWNVGYGQAAKNKILNSDFSIWQRGTSYTFTGNGYSYGAADRWFIFGYNASSTLTQQAFTAGAAPVAGYESAFFARFNSTGTANFFGQRIEDVRTFAGNPVTLSFWAKSASGQTLSLVELEQNFGSGGSASVYTSLTAPTLTTSWVRYSMTVTLPSISGKTVGTSSFLQLGLKGAINNAIDLWGVQVEYGSKSTPFQTATGTIQGELAACQRYYFQITQEFGYVVTGTANNTTEAIFALSCPTAFRTQPSISVSNVSHFNLIPGAKTVTSFNIVPGSGNICAFYTGGSTGLVANQSFTIFPNAASQIRISAEL
jgi:hypothetical protein